ncbi:flagellin [Marinibactrum halimedae]|uniref:Flagellin n=1 Tax=Marinibactrum halimedae TaxID=1444977 RepID=A0AA37WQP7_9GAMM|nr:flagellin [Marinibactrum halimedae]MCD9457996.1 flagellin FliC [Marinibactrum halimedae]GLS27622.1 flagellin [Marinibactrum halimedae]
MAIGLDSATSNLSPLQQAQQNLDTTLERISTGLRINSASDDAAGLQIANRLTSSINGDTQAIRNANDAISLTQTADAALASISDGLDQVENLALQSGNGILSAADRDALGQELNQVTDEITRVAETTEFNGRSIFNGDDLNFGLGENGSLNVSAQDVSSSLEQLGINDVDLNSPESREQALETVGQARENIDALRAELGATANRAESAVEQLGVQSENNAVARSRIEDADFARETANQARDNILLQASVGVQAQGNVQSEIALQLLGG